MKIFSISQMSKEILVFLAIVLLLKELGIIQAIKRFFNEETEKDEGSEEESTEEEETEEDESFNEEKVNEENTGLKVDSNVEEASEESFEDIECSDKESVKKVKPLDESEKRTTLSDPKVIPRVFMKNEHATPQPDPNKKTFDFKPIRRESLDRPLEHMKAEPTRTVKNEYPRVTFIDKNTAKLEESPNDVFYCMTQDISKIRMMPEKEQINQLRMMKSHIYPLQMDDDFIIYPFLL